MSLEVNCCVCGVSIPVEDAFYLGDKVYCGEHKHHHEGD